MTQNVVVAFPRGLAILGFQFPFDPLLWEANSGKILKTLFYEQSLGAENEISFLSAARRNYIFTRACPQQRSVWSQLSPCTQFSGTNQKPERRRPFGTGLVRHCPQGLFSLFFTFLRAIYFSARLDFSSSPLSAPGSPKMIRGPSDIFYHLATQAYQHINSFEFRIIMFSILFAGKHEKMTTYPLKMSLCLIALFAILFLACATIGNKTNQPSNNMVGDTATASDKSDKG